MKEKNLFLNDVEVIIERKEVKKIRLKVFPNGVVKLAAPHGVPEEWLVNYLRNKAGWVEKSLAYFKRARADDLERGIHTGASTRILGRQIRITVREANIYRIEQREGHLDIQSPVAGDTQALQRQFDRWWQKQSKAYFIKVADRLYPVISKHGIAKPALQVRKMKTLWGSCSMKRGRISLNHYLYKAPPPCIDYVVLHELSHFLYPRHDKDFYEFLTVHMPDWKERKGILDYEVVKGLGY